MLLLVRTLKGSPHLPLNTYMCMHTPQTVSLKTAEALCCKSVQIIKTRGDVEKHLGANFLLSLLNFHVTVTHTVQYNLPKCRL